MATGNGLSPPPGLGIGNGLPLDAAIALESWLRVTQRNLEAGAVAGEVPAHVLAAWDRWAKETREWLSFPSPAVEWVADQT